MKRIFDRISFFAGAAAALLLVWSCTKELPEEPVSGDALEDGHPGWVLRNFSASHEAAPKTMLDNARVFWLEGDCIDILWKEGADGRTSTRAKSDSWPADTARFSTPIGAESSYYAVYPAGFASMSGTELHITVPESLDLSVVGTGTFGRANLAVARGTVSEDKEDVGTLNFKNLCALLKFSVSNESVKKIVFSARGSEKVAGECTVAFDGSSIPSLSALSDASSGSVTLTNVRPGDYFIPVCPVTLSGGFDIKYYDDSSDEPLITCSITRRVPLTRSRFLNLGDPELSSRQKKWFVTPGGAGNRNGLNWDNAMSSNDFAKYVGQYGGGYSGVTDKDRDAAAARFNGGTFYFAEGIYTATTAYAWNDDYGTARVALTCGQISGTTNKVEIAFKGGYSKDSKGDDVATPGGATVFDGENESRWFTFGYKLDVTFENVTFQNGYAGTKGGGAVAVFDGGHTAGGRTMKLTFQNCTFTNNSADTGGAIDARTCTSLTLDGCTFSDNQALIGGAVYASTIKDFTVKDCIFDANGTTSGNSYGGAMRVDSANLTISGKTDFTNNSVTKSGGALLVTGYLADRHTYNIGVDEDEVDGDHVTFSDNSAAELGGAIYVQQGLDGTTTGSPSVKDGITVNCSKVGFSSNRAASGGAILIAQADNAVTLLDCSFSRNNTSRCGGAIATMDDNYGTEAGSRSHITMNGCSFSNNYSPKGGACYFWGNDDPKTAVGKVTIPGGPLCPTVSITGCTFTSNVVSATGTEGGAIFARLNAQLALSGTTFSDNHARFGGAVNASKMPRFTVEGCTFYANGTTSGDSYGDSYGGAMLVDSAYLIISGATSFTSNTVTKSGGALLVKGYDTDRHTYTIGVDGDDIGGGHVTFSGNSAAELGGAVYVQQGLTGSSVKDGITVNCSKVGFSSNSAASGGAILIAQADNTVTLLDCIFSGNHTSRCGGAIATMDDNYETEAGSRSHITMNGCSFSNNYSAKGGACYFWGNANPATNDGGIPIPGTLCPTVTATNTAFSGNYLTGTENTNNGGAVYGSEATLSFTGGSFSQNGYHNSDYAYYGGAFYVVGGNTTPLNLTGVSFSQNKGYRGGAVCAGTDALIQIHNCRFTGNEATSQFGGALATTNTSHAKYYLNACTFTGNKATATNHSGNVFYNKGGILCVNNCSLYENGQTSNSSGSDADFNFSDSDNASYPTGVIVMNTTVIKLAGYTSLVSFRIPVAFKGRPNNIQLCNNVVINKNETAGSGDAASIIKTRGYNFMEKGNSTFADPDNNNFSNDFTWTQGNYATYLAMMSLYDASSDYACYRFNNGTLLSDVRASGVSLSQSALETAVRAQLVGGVSFGSDFVDWLERLTVGDGNGFNRDIAGNARSTTALWPGCYEGTAE